MKVSQAIKYLLLAEGKVVIPKFGILTTENKKAILDKTRGEILPPTKKIIFKYDQNAQDQKLIEFLAVNNNINQQEAKKIVEDFVRELQLHLNNNKIYKLIDIGTFKKTISDDILFNQNNEMSLDIRFLGQDKIKINVPPPEPAKKIKKKQVSALWIILPLIIVILGILGYLFRQNIYQIFKTQKKNTIINTTPKKDTTIIATETPKKSDEQLFDENNIQYTVIFIGTEYKRYYIISGSYSNETGAKKRSNILKKYGYNPIILNGTYNRVAIAEYNSPDSIIKAYKDFVSNTNEQAWVLINKK